jgi:hypothetical protein
MKKSGFHSVIDAFFETTKNPISLNITNKPKCCSENSKNCIFYLVKNWKVTNFIHLRLSCVPFVSVHFWLNFWNFTQFSCPKQQPKNKFSIENFRENLNFWFHLLNSHWLSTVKKYKYNFHSMYVNVVINTVKNIWRFQVENIWYISFVTVWMSLMFAFSIYLCLNLSHLITPPSLHFLNFSLSLSLSLNFYIYWLTMNECQPENDSVLGE